MPADSAADTADYRRRARRIRASFAGAPLLRHRALGELAAQHNGIAKRVVAEKVEAENVHVNRVQAKTAQTKTTWIQTTARRVPVPSRPVISVIEQGFADYAATKLRPFGFEFCDRVKLLDSAEKLGIARFRANLILALQEHHAPARRVAVPKVHNASAVISVVVLLCVEVTVLLAMVFGFSLIK